MTNHTDPQSLSLVGFAFFLFALLTVHSPATLGQVQHQPFWLASRYDGDRVLICFGAVKFGNTFPAHARILKEPVAALFFQPVELTADYLSRFQNAPGAERFALGDEYDVLTGYGTVIPATLTTIVGSEGDEETGNNSYIGAIATLKNPNALLTTKDYYVARRHQGTASKAELGLPGMFAGLMNEPVRFDIQTQIVSLLTQKMMTMVSDPVRRAALNHSPRFTVQPFRIAGGGIRYYATAQWRAAGRIAKPDVSLAAWIDPVPTLRILAVETRSADVKLPQMLNVIDLGDGRTGIIFANSALDDASIDLVEYRDGAELAHMHTLQSIGAGE